MQMNDGLFITNAYWIEVKNIRIITRRLSLFSLIFIWEHSYIFAESFPNAYFRVSFGSMHLSRFHRLLPMPVRRTSGLD